ncbi:MAG: GrpB family protein [Bacilli bacterium]|nr:GrpB family protein [Bacilli bacterium]
MVDLVRQNLKVNKKIYKSIEKQLRKDLGKTIPIEHVGSTAIPNMYGKNIIDILVGAEDKNEFESIKLILEKNNFIGSEKSRDDIYQFFASSSDETGAGDIHIHLVIKNTQRFCDFITLRNYLLSNKDEAKAYSNLKKSIINAGIFDRKEYKAKKSVYVSELLERAREFYINK